MKPRPSPSPDAPAKSAAAGARAAPPLGVSVIIVNWKTKNLLLQLLEELRGTANPDRRMQVIVVDNDSDDGSVEAVRAQHDWVELLPQATNLGFARGVNRGIEVAAEPLILLLNTDVRATPAAVEALVRHAEQHPEAGVVGPRVLNEDGTTQASYWRYPTLTSLLWIATYLYKLFPNSTFNRHRYTGREQDQPMPVEVLSGCVFLIRRAVVEEIGGFDEGYFMYFEDTDLCLRVHRAGYELHYVPDASFVHFGGLSSKLQATRNFLEYRRSGLRYFQRRHGGAAAFGARLCMLLFLAVRLPVWALLAVLPGARGRAARQRVALYARGLWFLCTTPAPR